MSNIDEEIKERSKKMIDLFNSIKGMEVKNFPVPPFSKWLNGKIISAKRGEVEISLEIRPEMANPTGLLHGGVQCAMMDDIIGITSATLGYGGFLISIDFHADYLGKTKVGQNIVAKGIIQKDGKNIVHAEALLKDLDGNLISTASSNLLKTNYKPDFIKKLDSANGNLLDPTNLDKE